VGGPNEVVAAGVRAGPTWWRRRLGCARGLLCISPPLHTKETGGCARALVLCINEVHTHTRTSRTPSTSIQPDLRTPTHTHTESKSQQAAARRITTEPKSKTTKTQDANAGVQVRQDTRSDLGSQIKSARQVNRSDPIRVLPADRPVKRNMDWSTSW
jgi:hypothetical protein